MFQGLMPLFPINEELRWKDPAWNSSRPAIRFLLQNLIRKSKDLSYLKRQQE
jgi:hypothetical protein